MKTGSQNLDAWRSPLWVLMPVLLLIFNLTVGFNGLYGQDSFEYLRYSRALHVFISGGALPGIFYWPVLYPLSGAVVSYLLPDVLALQVVSILCYGLTILYLQKIIRVLLPEGAAETTLFPGLFFCLSPFVLRYSSFIMSDAMTMFFLTAFTYHYLRYREEGIHRHFLFLVFFAFAAINTRYAALALVSIPLTEALITFLRSFRPGYFVLSVLAVGIVFLPDMVLEFSGSPAFTGPISFPSWSPVNFFHHSFSTADGHFAYTVPNLCFVCSNLVSPGFIFAGIFFLCMLRRKNFSTPFARLTLVTVLVYALFLAGLATQNSRFLLLSFPLVVIFYAEPFSRVWILLRKGRKTLVLALTMAVIGIQSALFYRAFLPFYQGSRAIREIAARMGSYQGKTIYTFNIDQALRAYEVKNEIISLWSGRIDTFRPGSLILFNYVKTYRQWEHMTPLENWKRVNREHVVQLVERLPDGWDLYEIKN
jgi:hypothetical protein